MEMLIYQKPASKQLYLDPRTKMFLTIIVSTIMISGDHQKLLVYIQPCLAFLPFLFFVCMKRLGTAIKYALAYLGAATIPQILLGHVGGTLSYLLIGIVGSFTKMLPGLLMGYFLIATTSVSEFIAAMDRMHLSKKLSIPISVMFRFFPTIKEEYFFIKDAMRMREIQTLRNPIAMLEYRIVPLLMSIVNIGNELSASALTRGLGAPIARTNICDIGFHWQDIAAFVFGVLCFVGFIISMC